MMSALHPASPARRSTGRLGPLLEALRGLGRRHLVAALVVALLLALLRGYYVVVALLDGRPFLPALPGMLLPGIAVVVGIAIADAYVRRGARPFTAYAIAVVAAAVSSSILRYYLTPALGGQNWFDEDMPLAVRRTEMAFNAILQIILTGFGTATWLHWRDHETTSRRLRANELRRAIAERHLQQTQLRALQARLEPELLFGALQRVGELAGTAANESADRLLDELIALLRLLTASNEGGAGTVEHEFATAVAYLSVHDACAGVSRDVDIAIAVDAGPRQLPPMLVLPLVRAIARREDAMAAPLRIRAGCVAGRLTLDFARDDGRSRALLDASDLAALRRLLDESFGSGAASAVSNDSPPTLTVHLPDLP